jgi:hypothetical protein
LLYIPEAFLGFWTAPAKVKALGQGVLEAGLLTAAMEKMYLLVYKNEFGEMIPS